MTKTWDQQINGGTASFKGEWGVQTLFANAYWDFHNSTAFTPYLGGGLGMGFIKTKYTADVDGDGDSGSLTQCGRGLFLCLYGKHLGRSGLPLCGAGLYRHQQAR